MPLHTKRWNEPVGPDDGFRLLVTRFRPRGVKREAETWDGWMPELAPSGEVVKAFRDGKLTWAAYKKRYLADMAEQAYRIEGLARQIAQGDTITLLCSSTCFDPARCHRSLLAELISRRAETSH
jgi:uncharacterized protein YeaO (DUF488 family)